MVKPSERLGNYEVASAPDGSALILGSGAGGITYRGRHIHLGTEVAIKVLIRRKNLLQKDRDAFLSEARAAASLTHPQIARILDFGESAQQHPYYVMEICEGGSLEEFGRNSRSPDEYTCVQWFFESAAALAHAHQKGILHRDIKPSNLLVARDNQNASVKLIDFGLADLTSSEEASEQVIGTPHFAAPEQLRGSAEPASDVFSLGATFLWLLTGKHLSQGDVKNVISDRLEAASYAQHLTTLPPAWRSLLGWMLEIQPTARPQDGAAVMAAAQAAFPTHPGHPVPWDSAASPSETGVNSPPPSQWQECQEIPWTSLWTPTENPVPIEHGESLRARRMDGAEVFDVLKFSNLSQEISAALTAQADLIARHAAGLGLENMRLERGPDWWSIAWAALGTDDALSWVRQGRSLSTAEILTALDPIAAALDAMHSCGFEHLEIHPSMLIVSHDGSLKFSLQLPLPLLPSSDQAADSASTMPGATGTGLYARFASCVYQLISGRTPPPAAFVNARAYQAIPKLTERSNRFLSSAIAGSLAGGTCGDVTRGLAHEERIPGASFSGTRSTASWRSSPSISIPTTIHQPSRPEISSPPPAQAQEIPVPPKPPVIPSSAPEKKRPVAALTAAAVVILGATAWFLMPKSAKPPTPAPPAVVATPAPNLTSSSPTVSSSTKPAEELSLVKIPDNAATLAAAIALCKAGGTIEIAGGTYSEAVVLTKSVSLVSKTAALIQDQGLGASLVTIRGPIQVTLRNIQIKNTQSSAENSLESSPALVLIHDGSSVQFEGCVIEGSSGNGVSLSDKATAILSNCRVRKNRGYGLNVTSGSKVEISLSEIQENGRSGISVMNVESSVKISSGTTVSANSQNGVEVGSGAEFQSSGADIKANTKVGLIVEGGGSTALLQSSSSISENSKFAALVRNSARLTLSDSIIEENSESGIFIESGGQAEIATSRFKSNGKLGIQLTEPSSSLTLTKCDFASHTGAAALLLDGNSKVTACHFDYTPPACAIVHDTAAIGEISENSVNPGPLTEAINGNSQISLRDNVVKAAR